MANLERKQITQPDERRKFEHGKMDIVNIGGGTVGRFMAEPGWRWSNT